MPGPGFAVIDLETTGLFPGGYDRIVELAVVHEVRAPRLGPSRQELGLEPELAAERRALRLGSQERVGPRVDQVIVDALGADVAADTLAGLQHQDAQLGTRLGEDVGAREPRDAAPGDDHVRVLDHRAVRSCT